MNQLKDGRHVSDERVASIRWIHLNNLPIETISGGIMPVMELLLMSKLTVEANVMCAVNISQRAVDKQPCDDILDSPPVKRPISEGIVPVILLLLRWIASNYEM